MKKEKFSETDPKLKNFIKQKQLSASRIRGYDNVFREIHKEFGYTPSTLLEKARKDQKPYIDKDTGSLVFLEMDERTIYNIQTEYYDYLCDVEINGKPMESSSIKNKLNTYRGFLSFYEIDMPRPIKIPITRNRIRDKDIPTWNDVRMAIKLAKSPRDRAIIAMAATTGLRISDIVNLKISDLIASCDIYFEENQPRTLENLLEMDPDNLVPCWELNPQKTKEHSNLTITFNTPETTNYIFEYLDYRMKLDIRNGGDGVINDDEPLFISQRGKVIQPNSLSRQCAIINDRMGGEKDKNGLYSKFRLQNLRKLFKTTCRRNISKAQSKVKSDETFDGDIVSLFTGHITPNNPLAHIYEAVPDDSPNSYIRLSYQELIPYLKIVNDTIVKDFKTENYKEWEEEKNAMIERMDIQDVQHQREMEEKDKEIAELKRTMAETQEQVVQTNKAFEELTLKRDRLDIRNIITDHFYNNYRDDILQKEYDKDGDQSIGLKKCVVICEIAWEIALENESNFKETDDFLDSLIRQAIAKCSFNPKMIIPKYNEIHERNIQLHDSNGVLNEIVSDVIIILGNHEDVWEMIKEDQKTIKTTIVNHIQNSTYDINNITVEDKENIAENVIMEYLAAI